MEEWHSWFQTIQQSYNNQDNLELAWKQYMDQHNTIESPHIYGQQIYDKEVKPKAQNGVRKSQKMVLRKLNNYMKKIKLDH